MKKFTKAVLLEYVKEIEIISNTLTTELDDLKQVRRRLNKIIKKLPTT